MFGISTFCVEFVHFMLYLSGALIFWFSAAAEGNFGVVFGGSQEGFRLVAEGG